MRNQRFIISIEVEVELDSKMKLLPNENWKDVLRRLARPKVDELLSDDNYGYSDKEIFDE